MKSDFTILDLFAGVGGLSLGFEMVGAKPVAAIEHDERHAEIYRRNRGDSVPVFANSIADLEPLKVARRIGFGRRELDFIVGGPPCQPFSTAGKRNGTADARGTLVDDFVRFVTELEPHVFVMENVVGLRSIHDGVYLKRTIRRFSNAGYRCEIYVLDAADYGVPQHRRRLFVVGTKLDWIDLSRPMPTHGPLVGPLLGRPYVTVREAISDLPRASSRVSIVDDLTRMPYGEEPNAYQKMLRGRRKTVSGNGVTIHVPHISAAIALAALPEGAVHKSTRYRRLRWDEPSVTLRAGSGSFTALRPIHPDEARVITVREAARIQSFPDNFEFSYQKKWAYQQIGNSVPPLLARAIALKLVRNLVGTGARA